jgi:uncharacterized membrane protein
VVPDEKGYAQQSVSPFSSPGDNVVMTHTEHITLPASIGTEAPEEQETREESGEEEENERLLVFSDGIIAFALTVAAITIKIPANVEQLETNATSIFLRCTMYIIAFVIVAGAWADHHTIFHQIKRNNILLVGLNFFYLAATVLFPIGLFFLEFGLELVDVNDDVSSSQILLGFAIFLGSQVIAGLALFCMWTYANKQSRLVTTRVEPRFISYMARRLLSKPLLYVLAVVFIFISAVSPSPVPFLLLAVFVIIVVARAIYFRSYARGIDRTIGSDDTARIQLFSDAVIGIAITLAVAQIEFPSLGENSKGALEAVENQWPLLHAFLVGIVIMGVYWFFHYQLFRFIKRHDSLLVWLNCLFLLSITLMLVPINWFVNYYSKPDMVAGFFFSVWQIFASLLLAIMWWHARHKKRLLLQDVSDERINYFGLMVLANPLIFFLLLLVTLFVPTIEPTLYIILYLVLIGAIWLFSHLFTRRLFVTQRAQRESDNTFAG